MSENKNYVSLHTHSTYSTLDGISRRDDLIEKAKKFSMPGLAITDHGVMYNSIGFYKSCAEAGVKPIIGCEMYFAPDSRFGRTYAKKGEAEDDAKNGDLSLAFYHLTVLAKNRAGYDNLSKLNTIAHREGHYRKARIDQEVLEAHKDGLIVLSGCLASKISRFIVAGNKQAALDEIDKQRKIFGEDFYLEVMNHKIEDEAIVREALLDFGRERGIGVVMSGDSHYTEQNHALAHELTLALGTGKNINSKDRWTFNGEGYWFKSPDEMYESAKLGNIPEEALTNTLLIANKVEDYAFKLSSKTKHFEVPVFKDESGRALTSAECDLLIELKATQGLVERGLAGNKIYTDRLKEELETIKSKNFSSYFLIIADIIDFMRRNGMPTPPGRGSSIGSLTCYSLYITGMDPIQWDIPFSRFINPGRKDLPDIDTDISQARRAEVIDYIISKYGSEHVAQIVTFQTMGAKSVIEEVGRVLDVPVAVRRQVSKLLGDHVTKDDILEDLLKSCHAADEIMKQTKNWRELCFILEGNVKNLGEHAAGVVISNNPIDMSTPLVRDSSDGHRITQYDMKDLQELGLLKLDMLGLKTLDLIHDTIKLVKENRGIDIDWHKLPLDDDKTYKLLQTGKYVSVFQYDSSGMRNLARELVPENLEHLAAVSALYRPGPMEPGPDGISMLKHYVERRHGREPVEVWHPDLQGVFARTYGMPIFQESVMSLTKIIAGFTDAEADDYRSAIGKKDAVKFLAAQNKFRERGLACGRSLELMNDIIGRLEGCARYLWNIAHSIGYSFLSYVTAWLEANYPFEYYTTLLNVNVDKSDKLKVNLSAVLQRGYLITAPDINKSDKDFKTDGSHIYMGLLSIKGIGMSALQVILDERTKGDFIDYIDFCTRVDTGKVNKLAKEALVKAGAFKFDKSMTVKDMVDNTDLIGHICRKFNGKLSQTELRAEILNRIVLTGSEYTDLDAAHNEKAVLNFYISNHPTTPYMKMGNMFSRVNFISVSQINDQSAGTVVACIGLVESKINKNTKAGKPYLDLRMSDAVDTVPIKIWSPLATTYDGLINQDEVIILYGTVQDDNFYPGQMQLKVSGLCPMLPGRGGTALAAARATSRASLQSVVDILGAKVGTIEELSHGRFAAIFSETAYLTVDNMEVISKYDTVKFELARYR